MIEKIELAWVPMSERLPPAPGKYLTQRVTRVTEHGHGKRTIYSVILSAYWDGQTFNLHDQPTHWRDLPKDMQ
jgi:hypothetical protein